MDQSELKHVDGLLVPPGIVESAFGRCLPLYTAEEFVREFLFGVDLRSAQTREPMSMELIEVMLQNAVRVCETDFSLVLFESAVTSRLAFDMHYFRQFGYLKLPQRPVHAFQSLTIENTNGDRFYAVPLEWIDVGHLPMGRLNIVPLSPASATFAYAAIGTGGVPGSFTFLTYLTRHDWVPQYWTARYVAGFRDNCFPEAVRRMVALTAAIEVLSMLAATNAKTTSRSLGIDGLSQSQSTPGPTLYDNRIKQMMDERDKLGKKLKAKFGQGRLSVSTI